MGEKDAGRQQNESWFGTPVQGPGGVIRKPTSEREVSELLKDRIGCPAPVRPTGSRHSMTDCISAQSPIGSQDTRRWGTLVDMTEFKTLSDEAGERTDLPLRIDWQARPITVTVPAGRTFYDVAHELRRTNHEGIRGLQLSVNTELGTLTMGAAACGATKDSSFPGEFGQVCTDVVGMRLVTPDGKRHDFRIGDEELPALCCSYGLFGIVTEVTFRVSEHQDISIKHEKCRIGEFQARSRKWLDEGNAVFLYLFPYDDWIVAELRKKPVNEGKREEKSARLQVRNYFWERGLTSVVKVLEKARQPLRDFALDTLDGILEEYFVLGLKINRVSPVSQIVDFDREDARHRFTFSMWAFSEADFARILVEYFRFCKDHQRTFRAGLPHVSYHIAKDTSSLLSYSYHGDVWTLDPICPEKDAKEGGWKDFLIDFNQFCSERDGAPLLNQSPYLERLHVTRAFKERLTAFEAARRRFDPDNRMLNAYFERLLAP